MNQCSFPRFFLMLAAWCGICGQAGAQGVLTLPESPPASGFFTATASSALTGTGSANAKTWTFEAEGGDTLTLLAVADRANTYPRLRLRNPGGTLIASHDGTQQGEALIQNFIVTAPGTYSVQVYSDHVATGFRLRVDAGRGYVLEAESNNIDLAASPVTAKEGAGGFIARTAGTFQPGQGADYFDLGTLNAGNAVSASAALPPASTLAAGDWIFSLFRKGAENAPLAESGEFPSTPP